ncbi:HlyD family secretion protein [Novosphingobium sp. ERW19]|uniref:HlyD family secretion protein n=1 Tax=Novosphingobium sp. ERW19 TaxID=2726186 RepID=UPI00145768A4|nr:HlyD family secretion protein [Novosphingobium sp. ERW19]NLR40100.1 HlyD family secretion protein [Novosphingobium sp. ERW19]
MAVSTDTSPTASTSESSSGRKKFIGRVAVGALVVGALYGAYALYDYETVGKFMQDTEDAYVKADGVTISSKLGGYVRRVAVSDNQAVEQGALLVQIDPTDYNTRLAQSSAQVDVARATETASVAAIQEAQSAVGQARAALQASQRELAYLNGEVARMRPLVASGAEPKQAFDQLIANRDKAAADVAAKQAGLSAANDRVTSARAQAGQSAAQIKAAQAQREAASTDLATTRIVAPIGGKIGNSTVRIGQFVQPGQRLMTIVPTEAIYVEANFKETQIGLMRPGQPVTVHVDALPDVDFHGTVESITPGTGANFSLIPPQNATGNFTKIVQRVPVRIRINAGPESRKVLVPGLSLSVEVDTRSAKSAIETIRNEQDRVASK